MDKTTPEPFIVELDSPVFVEPAPALVADVLCEDSLEGTQTTRSLDVSHNSYDDHRRSLDHSDRLDHLLLVDLCKGLETRDLEPNVFQTAETRALHGQTQYSTFSKGE